jgi:predicted transglutaminase-like cysteine proteinase
MTKLSRANGAACCLAFLAGVLAAGSTAADEAIAPLSINVDSTFVGVPAPAAATAEKPIIVALANPPIPIPAAKTFTPRKAPQAHSSPAAAATFFTINQVLAKRRLGTLGSSTASLAALDSGQDTSGVPSIRIPPLQSDKPFGLFTFRAPQGLLWQKWHEVEGQMAAEEPALARCQNRPDTCSPAQARFVSIVEEAKVRHGRARLEAVNRRVNAAIRYVADVIQWHVADRWSAPLDARHNGSFETGLGDCEDYAIAKYTVLRAAGTPAADLKVLLVRDNAVHMAHAVLAARESGRWLILDNRWSRLAEDTELRQFTPLFALTDKGVALFAKPYASASPESDRRVVENEQAQSIPVGAEADGAEMASELWGGGLGSLPLLM